MDAPLKELERLRALHQEARRLLDASRPADARDAAQQALALEADNPRSLALLAEALERLGEAEPAQRLRLQIRQIRRDTWQRQVEAEARGQHDLLGQAIRHEKL
jgi:thioredoxin-like negative regulator of GroEL